MERLIFEAKIPHLKNMNSKNFSLWILALALLLMGLFGVLLFSPFLCMLLCIAGIVVTCVLLLRYNKCDAKSNLVPCNIGLIADSETVRWMLQRHTDDKYSDITGYDLDKEYIAVGDFYMNGNEFSARMFGGERASFYFVHDEDKAKAFDILEKLGWDVVVSHDASEYFASIPRTPRPYNKKSDAAKAAADAEQATPSKKKTDVPAATKTTAAKKSTTSSSSKKKAPAPAEKEPAEAPAPAEDKAEA